MKNNILSTLFLLLPAAGLHAQAISINTDASSPDPSAILDVKSTEKGMLVPRMTTTQRMAIAAPAKGLLVFDTDTGGFWFYNGPAWTDLSAPNQLADADKDTKIHVEKSPDEDIIRFDLAGTERLVLQQNGGGTPRLELKDTRMNTLLGHDAGQGNTTGQGNTAGGYEALASNTIGYDNVAAGLKALRSNIDGHSNTASGGGALFSNTSGFYNTACGKSALYSNTAGNYNTATGALALQFNASGTENTASGATALYANLTGSQNTATGRSALGANTTGWHNTANGFQALYSNTEGYFNTANGFQALFSNTEGYFNTANGVQALQANVSGFYNTASGFQALYSNTSGKSNVAIGHGALYKNIDRSNLVAVGDSALFNNGTGSTYLDHATKNTAIGSKTLFHNTTGWDNTANGSDALYFNTTGSWNTANGSGALYFNTEGLANTAVGNGALFHNTEGDSNTTVGSAAGNSNTTGSYNTYIGYNNNYNVTTASNNTAIGSWGVIGVVIGDFSYGSNNTFLGTSTGTFSTQGNRLTLIGMGANINDLSISPFVTTATAIGYSARVNCSNCLVLGGLGPDSVNVGIGLHTPVSDLHLVQKDGASSPDKLGVRLEDRDGTFWNTYVDAYDDYNFAHNGALTAYIQDGTGTYVAVSDARLKTGIEPLGPVLEGVVRLQPKWYHRSGYEGRPKTLGFIAQEVESLFPQLVFEKGGVKGLDYDYFGVLAIKAIQEQQAEIETLKAENAALKAQLDTQAAQLQKITAALKTAGIGMENR